MSITGGTITVTSQSGRGSGAVDANGQITFENATLTANGTAITSASQLSSH